MQALVFAIGIILLVFIQRVKSTYYVYTYDDGIGNDEHCCLVRLGENFCVAKPLTRSLLQVNKACQRLVINGKRQNDLNKIIRRLNVETSQKVGDKILLQLQTPLDKNILKNDLLCLSSATNNINLEKCFIELASDQQKKKSKIFDLFNIIFVTEKKGHHLGEQGKNDTADKVVTEEKPDNENGIRLIEISEPIQIQEGLGLAFHQIYELNLTSFRPTTNRERQCWSWYRAHTEKLCNHPRNFMKTCISLNHEREKCVEKLFYKKISDEQQESYIKNSITVGSKLYCEDFNKQSKFLGYHYHSEICFQTHTQISIQHKFTDVVSLSDKNKNKDVLHIISNDTKLTNEFEHDCHDKITLSEIRKSFEKQDVPIISGDNASKQE
ncbi:unnamed protein product [Rotaria sp. Silwood2]|nr:unnamed protein product [Rotaria sp. Silwood2]CAF4480350.1 unnamed protein product [Rotaria sp. Silwood2]